MSQPTTRARHIAGRLFQSSASSAFALSAVVGTIALSSGQAKAVNFWTPQGPYAYVSDADLVSPPPATPNAAQFDPSWSPWLGDKHIKILNNGQVAGIHDPGAQVEWSFQDAQLNPWHVDLDQQGNIDIASNFTYRVQIDNTQDGLNICATFPGRCWNSFYKVDFGIQANDTTVPIKNIYEAIGDTKGALIMSLHNGDNKTFPIAANDIIVEISWPANQAIGDMSDDYQQVPGPLPILGAGAAFGFSRKLRGRIKASRAA